MPSTYEKIATTTLATASTIITFSSIPNTFTDLIVVGKSNQTTGGAASFWMRFNGDSANNYGLIRLYYNGTGSPGTDSSNSNSGYAGIIDSGSIDDGSTFEYQIYDYSNTTTYKTSVCRTDNGSSGVYQSVYAHLWLNTAAINSITIEASNSMVVGTSFTIYGIKAA